MHYIHFIPLLKGNINYYYLALNIYILFLILLFIIFLVILFGFKSKKKKLIWPISILKYCLPIFFNTFFGQTFLLIISLFECRDGKTYYDSEVVCKNDAYFYALGAASILAILIQIFFGFITVSLYYQNDFIINNNNDGVLKKRNSKSELVLLLCKILIIFIFIFDREIESFHWGIIIVFNFLTGYHCYYNLYIQNYTNITIKFYNNFLSLTLFWSYITLLLEKVFQTLKFTGGIYLFSFGVILIFLYCFYIRTPTIFLKTNFNLIFENYNCFNYIKEYLMIIDNKDISRDALSLFNLFIEKCEENCFDENCPIKKYLDSLSKGMNYKFFLLKYAEQLFKLSIFKFPNDINLRVNFVIFLFTKMNNRKEAKKELMSIHPSVFSFNDNFILYVCKKYLEECNYKNIQNEEKYETINLIQVLEYKNYYNEFKNMISKASSLYYDFWSSLYNSHIQGIEDFSKLNEIGNQLNDLVEKLEKIFLKLNEIKKNDYEVVKLYESFIKNILNNNEKYKKYHDLSMNIIFDRKVLHKEVDFENFDMKILNECDESKYIIISMNEEQKGIIKNISPSACLLFGYHKEEIIGKNMNILIPEIFQKIHDRTFIEVTDKAKAKFFDNLVNKIIYKPDFNEICIHAKNSSKYLIPLYLKICLLQTEETELVHVVEISPNNSYLGELNDNINITNRENEYNNENIGCILTDNNLIIQTFTPNCINLLKLNSNIINANYDISSFIKQFNEEFLMNESLSNKEMTDFDLSEITDNNNNSLYLGQNRSSNKKVLEKNYEKKLKKKIMATRYSYANRVTWKIGDDKKEMALCSSKKSLNKKITIFGNELNNSNSENKYYEENLMMQVREAYISNKHVGYFFYFKKSKIAEFKENKTLKIFKSSKQKMSNFKRINSQDVFKINKLKEDDSFNDNRRFSRKISLYEKINSSNFINNNSENVNLKRIQSFNVCNNNIGNEFDIKINHRYIPECNFNFFLNIDLFSYMPSNNINSSKESNEKIKEEAINIINIIQKMKKKKKDSFDSSDKESNNSDKDISSSDDDDSSYISSSEEANSPNIINESKTYEKRMSLKKKKMIMKEENYNYEGYYKVNINNIKLLVYDFNQEMLIEKYNEEKQSEIEKKINEYKLKEKIYISEDNNFSYIYNYIKKKRNKNKDDDIKNEANNKVEMKFNKNEDDKDFEKKIIASLSQKDEQQLIIYFYIIGVFCFSIFLYINIYDIIFFVRSYKKLRKSFELIINSMNLKYYNNFIIYLLRELSLYSIYYENITNGTYSNFPTKSNNFTEIFDEANNTFVFSNLLIESILSSNLQLSKNTTYIINKTPFVMETLYNNNQIKKTESTLYVSLIQLFSTFGNILSANNFNIENPEIYNYIHNGMNNIREAFDLLVNTFGTELKIKERNIIYDIIFIICVNTISYLIFYFSVNSNYISTVKKKLSYFAVFYGIKLYVIKYSIKKCENFINKINQDEVIKNDIIEDSNESLSNSNIDEKRNNIKNIDSSKSNKKYVKIENYEWKKFQYIYMVFLALSYIFLEIIIILYTLLTRKFVFNGEYLYHLQNYHNNILFLFNVFREFLFDENFIISGISSYDYLIKQESELYSTCTEDIEYLSVMNDNIKSIYRNYLVVIENKFCNIFIADYFENQEECYNYIGGRDGIIKFGFHFLIHDFVEEIRMKRNYIKLLLEKGVIVGNFSDILNLKNYSKWTDQNLGIKNNKSLIFRMSLFNMEKTHSRLNIIFMHIIMQYINTERNMTYNLVEANVKGGYAIYIILILFHMFIIILISSIYLIPKVKEMNVEIYKAKNILTIIPVQILATLPNIRTLLNIPLNNQYTSDFN